MIREGEVVDSRQRQLGMLHGGQPWHYMEERFFPELRASGVHVVFETGEMERPRPRTCRPVVRYRCRRASGHGGGRSTRHGGRTRPRCSVS